MLCLNRTKREGNDEPFKIVDLDIYSEFIGSESEGEAGQFKLSVDVTYHGQTGGDDGVPTEPDDILGESPEILRRTNCFYG